MTHAQTRAVDALREAADTLESFVVSDGQAETVELMCIHIMRLDASPRAKREATLLMRMIDRG